MSARPRCRGTRPTALAAAALAVVAAALPGAAALHAQEQAFEAMILSPDPGERLPGDSVLVAVSFVDPAARLDPASLTLTVGARDVTAEAEIGSYTIRWRPVQPLEPGPKRVVVSARDRTGEALPPTSWTFNVTRAVEAPPPDRDEERPPPVERRWVPTGTAVLESTAQSVSGTGSDLRRDEGFVPRLWVNAGGDITGSWRYSTRIHVSGYESSDRQPVNRFRFDLRHQRLNVSLGDVNPAFQDLILAGRRVRGVQGEVRAGPFQLASVFGQSRRSIDGLRNPDDPTRVLRRGTYGQDLFAVRPAVGRGNRFQLGLTFLRVRDDVNSVDGDLRTDPDPLTGATSRVNPLPKDNAVAGTDLTFRLLDGRLLFQYENAVSLFANDITGGALSEADLDEIMAAAGYDPLEIDPSRWERIFILNASMIPLDPTGLTSVAHQFRSNLQAGRHTLSFEFRHIGPSYFTLGYPSLLRDREGFRVRSSSVVLGNDLLVSAGYERDEDNLDNRKPATTTSDGIFADVAWHPGRDRLALTAGVRFGSRTNELGPGTDGALDETNQGVSFGLTYPFGEIPIGLLDRYRARVNLNVALMNRDDDANPMVGSRNQFYLVGIQAETRERDSEFGVMYGLNRSELTGFDDATTTFHRMTGNLRRQLAPRWAGTFDGTLTLARSPDEAQELGLEYNRFQVMGGGEWEWTRASWVSFSVGFVNYSDSRFAERDTREILTRLRVNRAF